jgi:hypothetical protein
MQIGTKIRIGLVALAFGQFCNAHIGVAQTVSCPLPPSQAVIDACNACIDKAYKDGRTELAKSASKLFVAAIVAAKTGNPLALCAGLANGTIDNAFAIYKRHMETTKCLDNQCRPILQFNEAVKHLASQQKH